MPPSIRIISSWASDRALAAVAGAAIGLALGCAGEPGPPPEYPPMEAPAAAAEAPATPPEPPPMPPAPPIQVVAGEDTPFEGHPTVKVKAPREGQLISANKVEVTLDVKGWPLAPDPGQHIHLIVDNNPYIAIRDASKPIDLNALVEKELKKPLTEGTHVLRVFPGRAQHESVKEDAAFDVRVFHYKQKSADFALNPKAPLLTYSRPKGCVDAGSRVLLDFFVKNTKLSPTDQRVRYIIDGTVTGDIVAFKPHFIENLPVGEHTLSLSLRDANGELVPGPFNDTQRTITVAADCKALAAANAPPANPPLASTPTPAGPTTPTAPAPSEAPAPKPAH